MITMRKVLLAAVIITLTIMPLYAQQQTEKEALDELKSLMKTEKNELIDILEQKFLSHIKEARLRDSLKLMFVTNPPKLFITKNFLPEYVSDTYTIYVTDKKDPALNYLLGHYIAHIIYGKKRYKNLASELLINEEFNTNIRFLDPLWYTPKKDKNPLAPLAEKMNAENVWLVDLARFFKLVIEDKGFEPTLWQLYAGKKADEKVDIQDFWFDFTPEETEGYPLSVLYDIYDHESVKGEYYYEDDDTLNVRNGLDVVLSIILSKDVENFKDFEIYFGELFGSLETNFREVITKNNWQVIRTLKSQKSLASDGKYHKIIVHPQMKKITEFDKRQMICTQYELKIMGKSNQKQIYQFIIPMDYVPSADQCQGVYVLLEILKIENGRAQAKVKEGPVPLSIDFEAAKTAATSTKEENGDIEGLKEDPNTPPLDPPARTEKENKE